MDALPRNSRVAIYRRSSTTQQRNSIADQSKSIDRVVEKYELDVAKTYTDSGISGSTISARHDLRALFDEAKRLDIKFLLIYETSRLSRGGQTDFWTIIRQLKQIGVVVYCCQHHLFVTEENGPIFGIEASVARSHNVKHSRDITRTLIEGVATRKSDPGRVPPYGYDRMYYDAAGAPKERIRYLPDGTKARMDPVTGEVRDTLLKSEALPKVKSYRVGLVPGAPEAVSTLQRIYRLARTMGYVAIADTLNREGIPGPRGGLWAGSSIKSILENRVYTGVVEYGKTFKAKYHRVKKDRPEEFGFLQEGELNQGKADPDDWFVEADRHEALVSADDWKEVRAIVGHRARHAPKTLRSENRRYLLSGIARCGRCGAPLQGHTQRNKQGKVYFRYTCAKARKNGTSQCERYSLDGGKLEAMVMEQARRFLDADCTRQSLRQGLEHLLDEREKSQGHLTATRKALAVLEAKKTTLFQALEPKRLDFFKAQIDELATEEKRLRRVLAEAEREVDEQEDREAFIARAMRHFDEHVLALKGGCENALRESLTALGFRVVYYPDGKAGRIEVNPFGHSAAS